MRRDLIDAARTALSILSDDERRAALKGFVQRKRRSVQGLRRQEAYRQWKATGGPQPFEFNARDRKPPDSS